MPGTQYQRRWAAPWKVGVKALVLGAPVALAGCTSVPTVASLADPSAVAVAVFLGVLQGLTEFLPVSSSGHLLLAQWLLRVDHDAFGLAFDAAVHLGTLVAALVYFRRDLLELGVAFLGSLIGGRRFTEPTVRLAWGIALATVPGALAGLVLEQQISASARSPLVVAAMLVLFGGLLWLAERVGRGRREETDVPLFLFLAIGVAQALALVPGVSRSGATISAGLLLGLTREAATRLSFLLAMPLIAGAGTKQLVDLGRGRGGIEALPLALVGMAAAAISGYLVIWLLLRWVASNRLDVFVGYRFALAALVVALVLLGVAPG